MGYVGLAWLLLSDLQRAIAHCRVGKGRIIGNWILAAALIVIVGSGEPVAAANLLSPSARGYDISFPNCQGGQRPASLGDFTVIGVNGGRAFTTNPCFREEYQQARASGRTPGIYMNLNYPSGPSAAQGKSGPRGNCQSRDAACQAYNYGYNAAHNALASARSQSASSTNWWLDIETMNYWTRNTSLNAQVIQGAVDFLKSQQQHVGIYSIASMWQTIAGGYAPGLPNWVAQTNSRIPVSAFCGSSFAFGGGSVTMVQSWDGRFDLDLPCPSMLTNSGIWTQSPALASATDGKTTGPALLTGPITSALAGSGAGTSVSYMIAYPGNNRPQTVSFVYWPAGAQVGNALFLQAIQNGKVLVSHRGTDGKQAGQLQLQFISTSANPVTIQITNYNSPTTPAVGYWIRPS
ncbi:MAG TPA: hypothetical protein VMW65_08655 [Chloroflexota bacterium]|nr:hypothetical protein [Chloroflexota bacterium]